MGANGSDSRGTFVSERFEELRPLMFSIAYRMIGSVSEAEDIAQEAFLRFHRESKEGAVIDSPKAYLSTVTTRLAIDHLRSARVRRETYVGQWLPEPLLTDAEPDAAQHAETADSLSLAFLVLLESLSPVERAVFLLRDVFDYPYGEIALVVGKSEDNCRQIAARARHQVEARKPRFEASRQRRDELARRFFAATDRGDTGGRGAALPRPIHGRDKIIRLLPEFVRRAKEAGLHMEMTEVNGQPGCVWVDEEGRLGAVVSIDIADDQVQAVRSVSNPDKLRHLGEVSPAVASFGRGRRPPRAS